MAFSSKIFTAPKIGKGNISSPLSSGASKISKATPKLRVNRINFGNRRIVRSPALESQSPVINSSAIKSQSSIESTLSETNKILVDIQKQLALDFSMRIADEKEKNNTLKEEKSKRKFALKEGSLESVKKIGSIVKSGASAVLAPAENAFDKIIEFITLIGAGVAANAVFNWLSDDENKKKLSGWFDWIKENWQWAAAAVGAIALLPLIGTISGILGPIGALVGLLSSAVPLLLTVLTNPVVLGFAAGAGVLLGMKAAVDAGKRYGAGGQAHLDAFEALKDELNEAGITVKGSGKNEKFYLSGTGRGAGDRNQKSASGGTDEQKALIESYKRRRDALIDNKNAMKAEISEKRDAVEPVMKERQTTQRERMRSNAGATKMVEDRQATEKLRNEAESKVRAQFEGNIQGIIEARRLGGPVSPGTPYLVGEEGPELRVFEKGGSIISNPKTKNLLRNITPNKTKKTNIVTMDLPPEMLNSEKSPPARPAEPPIPKIPSTNVADMWRSKTPEMYGISV